MWWPTHWPAWLVLGVFWCLHWLPYRAQLALGSGLGRLAWHAVPKRRQVVIRNLELCFPDRDAVWHQSMARAHFRAIGIGVFEMTMCWWMSESRLRSLVTVHGMEHYRSAQALGRGVILFSAHFTTLEIVTRLFALEGPTCAMFRPPDNAVLRWAMQRFRGRLASRIIPNNDVRGMLRALKDNETIWYAADQSTKFKYAEMVPFFGEPALTNVALSRIAKMSAAAVVPFFGARRADGTGYDLHIGEALSDFPGGDAVADALRTNALIEEAVERVPEQYFWIHRRFKNRGPDYPDPYKET